MARTNLALKTSGRVAASAAITMSSADGTNKNSFDNSSQSVVLLIRNAHTATQDVAIKRPATVDGATLGDLTITVPANGGEVVVGPFPKSIYNQADDTVYVDPPGSPVSLTLAAIKLGSL